MKTDLALRYLLLRHMKKFESQVARDLFLEVTQSLHVAVDRHSFTVSWQASGEEHDKTFARSAFVFYRRGDSLTGARDLEDDLPDDNEALANAFAAEVFGIQQAPHRAREAVLEPYSAYGLGECFTFGVFTWAAGLPPLTAVVLLALSVLEFASQGRLLAAASFPFVAMLASPAVGCISAAAYGLLQFLDSNPSRRTLRVVLCVTATAIALVRLSGTNQSLRIDVGVLALAAVATAISTGRTLHGAHFRALPLAMPFICVGFYIDGFVAASLAGLLFLGAAGMAMSFIHRWSPVQKEQTLPPNG
jgi:hypothetical protein